MRQLLVAALALGSLVIASATAAADEGDTDARVDADATVAPYALVFHEGQAWKFDVANSIAMSTSQPSGHATNPANCHVASVEFFCDRKVARVECDSEPANQIVGGIYTSTGRGMWRTALTAAAGQGDQLDDKARVFARFPEALVDGRGKPIAQPFSGGWCMSSSSATGTSTLCVNAAQGITGGSIATAKGTLRVGAVPSTTAAPAHIAAL